MPARTEERTAVKGAEDAQQRCNELEAELAELRALYDLYFTGIERLPPLKKHDLFKRALAQLKGSQIRQTAAKFRIESIGQKLLTYERLWDRTLKEIEAGTYKRDLAKLKRREERGKKKNTGADDAFDVDEDLDLSDLDDEGDGDLSAALAAAEAAVSAPPPPPAIPSIKPLVPSIVPVTPPGGVKGATGVVPAITPLTPAGGTKPATGMVPAITPAITPAGGTKPATGAAPAVTRSPVVTPAGGLKITPSIPPAGAATTPPKVTSGSFPAASPSAPSNKPLGTGVAPAFKPGTQPPGSQPPKPAGTGMSAAFKPAAPSPSRPPAPVGADGGLSETKIKAIYDAYVMAKKRCGEDTKSVTLDSVSSSLKKQVPELMKQHNAKSVEFKVVIKDGKAVLRALPKE